MEIWKELKSHEGYYEVSNLGEIRSVSRFIHNGYTNVFHKGRVLTKVLKKGYYCCCLCVNTKRFTVSIHRMVALTFLSNNNSFTVVNHKNGVKTDNNVLNLEWCTPKQNTRHAYRIGLIKRPVSDSLAIEAYKQFKSGKKVKSIAADLGLTVTFISKLTKGVYYTHLGLKPIYRNKSKNQKKPHTIPDAATL